MKVDINHTRKKYHVIYSDPPYEYRNKKTGGGMNSGSSSKYVTMNIDQICELPVKDLSHKKAVLFCWITTPLLVYNNFEYPHRIFEEWGFKAVTMMTWDKDGGGWGFWFRTDTEHIIIGTKGDVRAFRSRLRNIVRHKKMGHSVKPDIFREHIEKSTTQFGKNRKMIELFARKHPQKKDYARKWDYFGSEYK